MASIVVLLALIPTTLVFFIVFLSLTLRSNEKWKASKKLPPGNFCLPLIGESLPFFKPHSPTVLGDFMESRISRFGKIFLSNLLGNWTIVSADPELNQFVLKNEMRLFSPGWPAAMHKLFGKDAIAFVVGHSHKVMRSIMVDFLGVKRVQSVFMEDAEQLASLVMDSWDKNSVILARDETVKFSLNIIVKNVIGMNPGDPDTEKLQREYGTFRKALISYPIPIPGTTFWKALKAKENIIAIIKRETEERIKKNSDGRTDEIDFVGRLMKYTDFSPETIGLTVLGAIFSGQETTSKALAALIYFLADCPKAVQQLREEHLQVLRSRKQKGESKLTYEDYKSMEFTKCVINEILRITNISGFVLRKANQDIEFKGHLIPQGYNILVHFASVNLDPNLYENPSHFDPWRWQGLSATKIANDFTPFGGGVRLCPGAELARIEMSVFLHHLILKYDWELAEPDQPTKNPFPDFPKGLPIKVRATSTCL